VDRGRQEEFTQTDRSPFALRLYDRERPVAASNMRSAPAAIARNDVHADRNFKVKPWSALGHLHRHKHTAGPNEKPRIRGPGSAAASLPIRRRRGSGGSCFIACLGR